MDCLLNFALSANVETDAVIIGKREVRNGKEYLQFDDITLDLRFGSSSLEFEDLIRGNKELTDQTNKVINENIEEILKEIKPVFDKTVSSFCLGILRGIYDRYALSDLFL